jgi:hypothetical protein
MKIYLSADGSYGDADDLLILTTDNWEQQDYDLFDSWSDTQRGWYAHAVRELFPNGDNYYPTHHEQIRALLLAEEKGN